MRPLLPRLDTPERALRHPVVAELMAAGALDEAGNADPMIREWLTVLVRRDLGLLVTIGDTWPRAHTCGHLPIRHLVGGVGTPRAIWCVFILPAPPATRPGPVSWWLVRSSGCAAWRRQRRCGRSPWIPSSCSQSVRDAASLRSFLLSQRLDVDQLQIVTMAADPARSAHAAIVALQAGVGPEEMARLVVGDSTVSIIDTPAGRVCVESVTSGQRRYQVLSPGSRSDIGGAVQRLIRRLPAGEEWYSYRRVV